MSLRMRVVLDLIVIRAEQPQSLCTGDALAPHKRAAVIETVRSAFKCMPGTPEHGLMGLSSCRKSDRKLRDREPACRYNGCVQQLHQCPGAR